MLPSFRFLFAAILFSMSILVFGLGAAALLRTAHEEFANNPFWHAAPETTFAQQSEATRPVLALLRVGPVPAEQEAPDDVPSVAAPASRRRSLRYRLNRKTSPRWSQSIHRGPRALNPKFRSRKVRHRAK